MSRFFKSAAFPILIVVVLAFFAQKLIGSSGKSEKQTFGDMMYQLEHNGVQSLSLHEKDNTANVTTTQGQKYTVGYPDGYVSQIITAADKDLSPQNFDIQGKTSNGWLSLLTYILPVRDLHRVLDIPDEPGPGRRLEGDVVRQIARQANVGRLAQDHVP